MSTHQRVVSAIVTVVALAACAATTPNVQPNTASAAAAQNPACMTQTGSHITGAITDCMAFGRSYSKGEIDTTGKVNLGDALQILDPSVSVRH
jgi:hypothetical protein